jgi:hypothetical protein
MESEEAAGGRAGKRPTKKPKAIELQVIDKVLRHYKKHTGDKDFTVSTAEVTKLIQLKQEIEPAQEEGGDVGLHFPEVPCLNSGSDS